MKKLQGDENQTKDENQILTFDENVFETFSERNTKADEPLVCNESIDFDSIFGTDSLDSSDYFTL